MRRDYTTPDIEIEKFTIETIFTASGWGEGGDTGEDGGEDEFADPDNSFGGPELF